MCELSRRGPTSLAGRGESRLACVACTSSWRLTKDAQRDETDALLDEEPAGYGATDTDAQVDEEELQREREELDKITHAATE